MPPRKSVPAWALTPRPAGVPIIGWLYDALRARILDGRIAAGERLPATRDLAREHGVSRGVVVLAYEQLAAEGYLAPREGSGTYAARILPDELLEAGAAARAVATGGRPPRHHVSAFAKHAQEYSTPEPGRLRAFRTNVPALHLFPMSRWAQVAARRLRRATVAMLHGCESAGHRPLRDAVAGYLTRSRGVRCTADHVLIVSGVQEALDLATRVLVDRGERVALEEPGHMGARFLFAAAGAHIVRVPVDAEGAELDPQHLRGVRLLYLTPAHQFPLGVSMSLPRRIAMLEWARRSGAMIFEDDYDSEFRYSGRPLPALQGLGGEHHVLFAGSFSKVMFPSLRLGYLVVPPELFDHFSAAMSISNRHAPPLDQAILADFIDGGDFARHVRRMRGIYAERLSVLTEAARRDLAGRLELSDIEAGLQTVGWLAPGLDAGRVAAAAREKDVSLVPIARYGRIRGPRQGIHMGFAAVEPREIRRGIGELAAVVETEQRRARVART